MITAEGPILGAAFDQAARSLDGGQRRSAVENLGGAAESLGRLAPVLAAEEDLQERIAALEREIGEREGAGGLPGTEGSDGDDPGARAGTSNLSGNLPGAGLESNAQGRERGAIEMLGLDERLDAAGNLEIVGIQANDDAPVEDFAPPVTPSARAPKMIARWEMDLSPGTVIFPCSPRAPPRILRCSMPLSGPLDLLNQDLSNRAALYVHQVKPRDVCLPAEPGHLTLGIVTGFLLGEFGRLLEALLSEKKGNNIAIVVAAKWLYMWRVARRKELLDLPDKAGLDHTIYAVVDPPVQVRTLPVKPQ